MSSPALVGRRGAAAVADHPARLVRKSGNSGWTGGLLGYRRPSAVVDGRPGVDRLFLWRCHGIRPSGYRSPTGHGLIRDGERARRQVIWPICYRYHDQPHSSGPRACHSTMLRSVQRQLYGLMRILILTEHERDPSDRSRAGPGSVMQSSKVGIRDRWSEGELVEGIKDLSGFGAGAVVGVDVDPAEYMISVQNRRGRHRQCDRGVGVHRRQVQA